VISYGLNLLENSKNSKDHKIGSRIARDIKHLRRIIDGPTLKKLWEVVGGDYPIPASIASITSAEIEFSLKDKVAEHPFSKAYVMALTLSYLLLKATDKQELLELSNNLLTSINNISKWYLDHLWSYIYYLYARSQEINGTLSQSKQ